MNERDEILIQRCVDGELSSEQRHELLQRMEEAAGWKHLACSYMEDQLFAVAGTDQTTAGVSAAEYKSEPAERRKHWFHHPAMSVALTACVAFLLGLVINRGGDITTGEPGNETVADNEILADQPDPVSTSDLVRAHFVNDGGKEEEVQVRSKPATRGARKILRIVTPERVFYVAIN
ncbi:MAG TPA: hypothetical protein DCG12_05260 [Planctomycetaceae bacterium]|nr:hypothetical protein [Planctomycetaceae bacterium]